TARAGGVAVTATASLTRVDWDMGDGHTLTCHGPGTPYQAEDGSRPSPDCGYSYPVSSAGMPDESFTVTATLHWSITAAVAGPGAAPAPGIPDYAVTIAPLELRIAELQVLN